MTTLLQTSDGDNSHTSEPPVKKVRKHGRRDIVKVLHMSDGGEVWDLSEEDYSYDEDI
jgi:hypothetical protein